MSIRTAPWPEGTPAWVDLMVPDLDRARDFYGALFDWTFDVGPASTGYYTTCLRGGEAAAGIGGVPEGMEPPPSAWTTYLAVDDAAASAERAVAAGAQIVAPAMEVMGFGSMAVVADPTGAVVGLWQSGSHTGANVVNEPGAVVWNEVMTRDVEAAKAFFGAVFGFEFGDMSAAGFTYATIDLDGRPVGGIGQLPDTVPTDVPPHWVTYFGVADTDAACARATELGGRVARAPGDTEFGRQAVVVGPFGEAFTVMSVSADYGTGS